jgi:hypothetical protein
MLAARRVDGVPVLLPPTPSADPLTVLRAAVTRERISPRSAVPVHTPAPGRPGSVEENAVIWLFTEEEEEEEEAAEAVIYWVRAARSEYARSRRSLATVPRPR